MTGKNISTCGCVTIQRETKEQSKCTFLWRASATIDTIIITKYKKRGYFVEAQTCSCSHWGRCMLRSFKLAQPRMLKPCSLAKCSRQMKHRWGETSFIVAAALQSLGKLAKRSLKDTASSWSCGYIQRNHFREGYQQ